jgi:hypothetical protein
MLETKETDLILTKRIPMSKNEVEVVVVAAVVVVAFVVAAGKFAFEMLSSTMSAVLEPESHRIELRSESKSWMGRTFPEDRQ